MVQPGQAMASQPWPASHGQPAMASSSGHISHGHSYVQPPMYNPCPAVLSHISHAQPYLTRANKPWPDTPNQSQAQPPSQPASCVSPCIAMASLQACSPAYPPACISCPQTQAYHCNGHLFGPQNQLAGLFFVLELIASVYQWQNPGF